MANIEDMPRILDRLQKAVDPVALSKLGANNFAGLIKRRIFNEGKDAHGRPLISRSRGRRIGAYSYYYARKRLRAGRQASYVDLEFSGRLRRSMQVGKDGKEFAFGILPGTRRGDNISNVELSQHLEKQYGKIFIASASEADLIVEAQVKHVRKMIKKAAGGTQA